MKKWFLENFHILAGWLSAWAVYVFQCIVVAKKEQSRYAQSAYINRKKGIAKIKYGSRKKKKISLFDKTCYIPIFVLCLGVFVLCFYGFVINIGEKILASSLFLLGLLP